MAKPNYSEQVDSAVQAVPDESFEVIEDLPNKKTRTVAYNKGDRSSAEWKKFVAKYMELHPDANMQIHGKETADHTVAVENSRSDEEAAVRPEEYDPKATLEMTRKVKAENDKRDEPTLLDRALAPLRDNTGPASSAEREQQFAKLAEEDPSFTRQVSPITGPEKSQQLAKLASSNAAAADAAKYVHEYAPNAAAQAESGVVADVPPAQAAPTPEAPGFLDRAKNAIVSAANSPTADAILQFGNGIAGLTGGQQYPLNTPPAYQPQQALASTEAPPPVAAPPVPAVPGVAGPPPEAPPPPQQKLSAGDVGEQGQMQYDPNDPYRDNPIVHGLRASGDREAAAINAQVDAEQKQHAARLDTRRELMTKQAQLDLDEREATQKANAVMEKGLGDYQRLQAQVLDASRTEINPGRYWQNKDAGQKVAAVIAGALFGFTGQGMQYLQHLDAAVAQDIDAQKSDIANRREGLQQAVRGQENYLQMARQHGLDGVAAVAAARASMYRDTEQKIAMIQDQYPATAAIGMQMQVQVKQRILAEEAKVTAALEKESLAALSLTLKQKNGGVAASAKLKTEAAGQQRRMGDLLTAADEYNNMFQDWKKSASKPGQGLAALAVSPLPKGSGRNLSSGAAFDSRTHAYVQSIGQKLHGGKMTDQLQKDMQENTMLNSLDTEGTAIDKVKQGLNEIQAKYEGEYNSQKDSGRDVSQYPTPEEFAAKIIKKTGINFLSDGSVPGERPVQ